MAELGENQLNEKTQFIFSQLKDQYIFWYIRKQIKEEIIKPKYKTSDISDLIPKLLRELGLDAQLKNKINELYQTISQKPINSKFPKGLIDKRQENLEPICKARVQWAHYLSQRIPLVKLRTEQLQLEEAKSEENQLEIPCVYDISTLLPFVTSIACSNAVQTATWGDIQLQLRAPSLEHLRATYQELELKYKQIGIDDDKEFIEERSKLCEKLLQKNYAPYLLQLTKRGLPAGYRSKVYKRILDVEIDTAYIQTLETHLQKYELLTDFMIRRDSKDVGNDDKFFVFLELVEKMMLLFSRDPYVHEKCVVIPHIPLSAKYENAESGLFPPNGIIPFKLYSKFCAGFCYISESFEMIYFLFREFFCRYFCLLQSITQHPHGLLSLCKLFEDLLQFYEPELVYHLQQIGLSALEIAFPWLFYGFAGYLEVDQWFLLLDRVIAYDSTEIIAILAVALFVFRAPLITNTTVVEEIHDLFRDLSQIKVMPLLQHLIFAENSLGF